MNNILAKFVALSSFISIITMSTANAAAWLATVPADYWDTEGESGNLAPFDTYCDDDLIRHQQIIPGSLLGSGNVDSIAFRLDGGRNYDLSPATYHNASIKLSSTQLTPSSISRTYEDNIGPDETEVFSGDMVISGTFSDTNPNPFNVFIPIDTNFEFDGNNANLLLDMTFETCQGGYLVIDSTQNVSLGRLYGPANEPEGRVREHNYGLIMQVSLSSPPPTPNTAGLSGNWSIDGHTGEGFLIDVLDNGLLVVFWFTYDPSGNPVWLLGTTDSMVFDEADLTLSILSGATFGAGFDPDDVVSTPWGTMHIEFDNCGNGSVDYSSSVGYGSGNYTISKVYGNEQTVCTP